MISNLKGEGEGLIGCNCNFHYYFENKVIILVLRYILNYNLYNHFLSDFFYFKIYCRHKNYYYPKYLFKHYWLLKYQYNCNY